MAISPLLVLKLRETEDQVVYGYGDGPDELEGEVVFSKTTGQPEANADLVGRAKIAAGAVYTARRKTGEWPSHYTYAA